MSRTATLIGGAVAALTLQFLDHRNLALVAVAVAVAASGLLRGRKAGPVLLPTDNTLDHFVPHAQGGSDEMDNLLTSCWRHNRDKGARTFDQWMRGDPPLVLYPDRERDSIPAEVRLAVYERDDHRCRYCEMGVP